MRYIKRNLNNKFILDFNKETGARKISCRLNGVVETVQTYDATWLANNLVDKKNEVNDNHFGRVCEYLEAVKNIVEDKKDCRGENPIDWQRDEKGHRRYKTKLVCCEDVTKEIGKCKNEFEKLKKAFEWEKKEHLTNGEYFEEAELIEEYFSHIFEGACKNKDEEESFDVLYKEGWVSLIEKVQEKGCWGESLRLPKINSIDDFYITGEADIVSRDTLYYVTTSPVSEVWVTFYLNILNLIFQKPLLAVLHISSKGLICEEDIAKFNSDEEVELIKLLKQCRERKITEKETINCFGWYPIEKDNLILGLDKSRNDSIHQYIDEVIGGAESLFDEDSVNFIKKFYACDGYKYSFVYEKIKLCELLLKLIDVCIDIQKRMGEPSWNILVKNILNSTRFEPICSLSEIVGNFSTAELYMRLMSVLSPIYFAHSPYSKRFNASYDELREPSFKLTCADYRRVELILELDKKQRRMLNSLLTSSEFLGINALGVDEETAELLRDDVLKHVVLEKKMSGYFCANCFTPLPLPFEFVPKLKSFKRKAKREEVLEDETGTVIIDNVNPVYFLDDKGVLQAEIQVECIQLFSESGQSNRCPKIAFAFTMETPHEVLDAFFTSFWIKPCTYDFDSWVGLYGNISIVDDQDEAGFPALSSSELFMRIVFNPTSKKRRSKEIAL